MPLRCIEGTVNPGNLFGSYLFRYSDECLETQLKPLGYRIIRPNLLLYTFPTGSRIGLR